jgi:hypothetical protein
LFQILNQHILILSLSFFILSFRISTIK